MKLLHYSAELLHGVANVGQSDEPSWKPEGLWVSTESADGWKTWCEANSFALDRFKHTTEVVLASDARILYLTTVDALRAFSEKYGKSYPGVPGRNTYADLIDWKEVAAEYHGIVIAPYQWELRYSHLWYNTWDCASGCIWDAASAVLTLVPIQETRVLTG